MAKKLLKDFPANKQVKVELKTAIPVGGSALLIVKVDSDEYAGLLFGGKRGKEADTYSLKPYLLDEQENLWCWSVIPKVETVTGVLEARVEY